MNIIEWTFAGNLLADFDNDGAEIFIAVSCDDGWRYCGRQFIDARDSFDLEIIINEMIQQILTGRYLQT